MTLHLYDTAARAVREFVPLVPGRASVYLCGATVQAPPHIGHIRSGVSFDVLRRWLEHRDHEVTFVRNVTDIDDKILAKAAASGEPFWAVAARNETAFRDAYDVLGCLPPTIEPRATGHVTQMVELMARLIDAGHAYAGDGDVYFSVSSWAAYGELSGQRPDEVEPAADSTAAGKRDPRDFALWKSAKPGEPTWPTPWGDGRPGWHLECSAMARCYLGPEFDIHGGGIDLVFPHHENEAAQSRAAGDGFARYWLHNGWVTTSGEKMSKSLGNSLLVSEVVSRVRPVELRYYLVAPHYRSHVEFSEGALAEAAAGFRRIENFVSRASERCGGAVASEVSEAFAAAMDDDLGVPAALAVLHDAVRAGNAALAGSVTAGSPTAGSLTGEELAVRHLAPVLAMLGVLGLDPTQAPWVSAAGSGEARRMHQAVDVLVGAVLEARAQARTRKDFATADTLRDQLAAAGVEVEDTPEGPRWSLAAGTRAGAPAGAEAGVSAGVSAGVPAESRT